MLRSLSFFACLVFCLAAEAREPSTAPARVPSFGPNGTHWPANTPWPESSIPHVVDVPCTWEAIGEAISKAADSQINEGLHIRVAPGSLSGNGAASGSQPVLENIVKAGLAKNILISPRDGWGTVEITEPASLRNVQGVTFARINAAYILLTNCSGTNWAQSKVQTGFRIQAARNENVSNCNAYEIVLTEPRISPEDPMGYAAGENSFIRDCVFEGFYVAPFFRALGSNNHLDTLQMYGRGAYRGLTIRDSVLWGSLNCALQIGGAREDDEKAGTPFLTLDHTLLTSQIKATEVRYPVPEGGEAPKLNQAINGAGEPGQLYARDSLVFGTLYTTQWAEVRNSRTSVSGVPERNKAAEGGWDYDSKLESWKAAEFDKIAPVPTDEYLATIWGGKKPAP